MADPISLATGVIGIVATGFTIAQGLHQIANGIGSAGQEVRMYADEVDGFSKMLKMVRAEILRPPGISSDEQSLIKDVMDICDRVLLPLNRLQSTLQPLLVRFRKSSGKLRQFGLRVQWYFSSKDKLLFYREALKAQHRVLDTILELMILQANRDRAPQATYISILQVSLEHSIAGLKRSLDGSTGFFPPRLGHSQLSSSSILMQSGEPIITEVENEFTEKQEEADAGGKPPRFSGVKADPVTTHRALISSPLTPGDAADELSQEEVQSMNEQIEHDLDPDSQVSARELWEDMRTVSRKVLRLASETIRSTDEDTAPQASAAMDSTEIPSNSRAPLTKGELEETPIKNSIIFEDANGAMWELPLSTSQRKDITSLIEEMEGFPRALKPFTLIGPDGQRILPSTFFLVAKPGWKVILRWNESRYNISGETVAYRQAEVARERAAGKRGLSSDDPSIRIREQVLQDREEKVKYREESVKYREQQVQTKEREISAREQDSQSFKPGKLKKFFLT